MASTLDLGPLTTRIGLAARCGPSARPTSRPSSPTSPATPTSCWPAPGRSAGGGGAGAGQRGPARRFRSGAVAAAARGRLGRGSGPCPGGRPPAYSSGAAGGLLGHLIEPRMSLVLGGLAALAAGWAVRFRPRLDAVAWRRGAAGERRSARLLSPLERHGWAVLNDLAVPGNQAKVDHLVIGPGSVFAIELNSIEAASSSTLMGNARHGRYPLGPHSGSGVVGGRPGRPGPARPRHGRGADRGRRRRPRSAGVRSSPTRCRSWRPAPPKHAWSASGRALGARAGCLAGRPGPGPLPRRRLTDNARGSAIGETGSLLSFPSCRMRTWRWP